MSCNGKQANKNCKIYVGPIDKLIVILKWQMHMKESINRNWANNKSKLVFFNRKSFRN